MQRVDFIFLGILTYAASFVRLLLNIRVYVACNNKMVSHIWFRSYILFTYTIIDQSNDKTL